VETSPFRAGRKEGIYRNEKNTEAIGMNERNWNIVGAAVLIALGVMGRVALRPFVPAGNTLIAFDLFAIIGMVSLMAGVLLGGIYTLVVPLTAMAVSDAILGNGMILVFTWSGFAMMGGLGLYARKGRDASAAFGLRLTGIGVAGILAFDIWTNFGWWLLSPMYPHTASGLAACYAMGLPFMVGHMLTTAAMMPAVTLGALYTMENRARLASALKARLGVPGLS
jgi:hypothetical protein